MTLHEHESENRQESHGKRRMRVGQKWCGPQRKGQADCEFWGLRSKPRSKSRTLPKPQQRSGHCQRPQAGVVMLVLVKEDSSNL